MPHVTSFSPGKKFKLATKKEKPLQIVGAINAYCAIMAAQAGFRALYLSGAGVAVAAHGLPDLGMTNLNDVLEEARRITYATDIPLLVDIDTGWGSSLNIARTIKDMIRAGVAAVHLEDQIADKRCGHRPSKQLVSTKEMKARIKAAVDAKTDPDFVLMARTDAFQSEGLQGAIDRACQYIAAGADMIFIEALTDLEQYRQFAQAVKAPVLANITEFGKTPLFTLDELRMAGINMALYPLSAFRAMSAAANRVYLTIRQEGSQKNTIDMMQTRDELYRFLNYHAFEKELNNVHD